MEEQEKRLMLMNIFLLAITVINIVLVFIDVTACES